MMIELDPDSVWSHDEPSICSDNWKSQEGPTLSSDIWSKFDLLLTPPRTPLRDAEYLDLVGLPDDINLGDLPLLEEDDLQVNLDFLDDLDVNLPLELTGADSIDFTPGVVCSHGQVRDTCTSCEKLALAGSELRHDCMWIGTCTAEAHANQKNRIHHDSTCSHISDFLSESAGSSLEVVSRFTQLDDFRDQEDEDDTHLDHDDDALDCNAMPRPDTPSESSETDSDEELEKGQGYDVSHEEVVYTSGSPSSSGIVHSDHTYHCMPPPSPRSSPANTQAQLVPSYLHTPSDSEDEIDVVGVGGNTETSYSCSTRPAKRNSNTNPNGTVSSSKKNRSMVLSSSEGAKKIFRIHTSASSTSSLNASSSKSSKKPLVHESPAEGVKLKSSRRSSGKSAKRLLHHQRASGGPRKRAALRNDADDPEKREIHNSLERMRRVDLRNAFEELRVLIPDLSGKDKAPKVEILKKAAHYCLVVQEDERSFLAQLDKQRKYNLNLMKRLNSLQRR